MSSLPCLHCRPIHRPIVLVRLRNILSSWTSTSVPPCTHGHEETCVMLYPPVHSAHTQKSSGKNPLTTPLSSCGTLTNSRQTLRNIRASDRNTNHRKTHLSQRRFQTTVRPKYNRKCFLTLPTTMVKRNCITIVKAMQNRLADEDPSFQSFHN